MIFHGIEWCLDCFTVALHWILWSICKWLLVNAVVLGVVLAAKHFWGQRSPNPVGAEQQSQPTNKHAIEGTDTPDTHTHEAAGRTGTGELTT